VDMGASELGGNVTGSRPGDTVVTGNGIRIIGADNLAATVPTAASNAYSRNISALLLQMTKDGALVIDTSDEIQAGVVIAHDGKIVHEAVARLLAGGGSDPPPQAARPAGSPRSEPAAPAETLTKGGVTDVSGATD